VLFQVLGQIGLVLAIPKLLAWAWRLRRGPIVAYDGLQPARVPMLDAATGREMNWAIENVPAAVQPEGPEAAAGACGLVLAAAMP
jgi:hypothetical protein